MRRFERMGRVWLGALLVATAAVPAVAGDGVVGGVNIGTNAGLGVQASGMALNFTRDLPLSARFSLAYHATDAGDPYAARRIFINDNTNGDPQKSATMWQLRFDLVVPAFTLGPQKLYLFAGPRHARYAANYDFVGGNENFDVSSHPWGAGAGLESWFAMGDRTDFVLQAGFDWFAEAKLEGHDTAYLPTGDHINPRDYTYEEADAAIGQPRFEILAMMGLRFRL